MIKFLFVLLLLPLSLKAEEMRLLTWNVFMIPKPINFSLQKERTKIIASELKDSPYDIVLMQEAFLKSFRTTLGRTVRAQFPYQEFLQRSRRPWHFMSSGLFVVSRLPFKVLDHWYYTRCTHADCLSAKGLLLIEVALPSGKKVQIAMTHTQAWDDSKAVKIRYSQFQEIREMLDLHAVQGVPQVLAGDLNVDGNAEHEFPGILNLMQMSSRPLDEGLKYTNGFPIECYKKPSGPEGQWLDHIFLDPRGSGAKVLKNNVRAFTGVLKGKVCPLSDHHSVEAVLSL